MSALNDFPMIFCKKYSISSLSIKKMIFSQCMRDVSLTVEDGELQAYANFEASESLEGETDQISFSKIVLISLWSNPRC